MGVLTSNQPAQQVGANSLVLVQTLLLQYVSFSGHCAQRHRQTDPVRRTDRRHYYAYTIGLTKMKKSEDKTELK